MEKIKHHLPTPLLLLSFILSFLAIYANGAPILQDPDMGWHIAAGDLIRSLGHVPMHDTWSFSGTDQVWYNISWLWDIVLSFVHEQVGLQGLFVFTVSLPALLVALLLSSLQKRGGIGVNALIFIGVITTYCMFEFATGRPQIVGMFLALFFYNILHESRSNPNTWKVWLLPLLMIVWVNVHGSFFAGFIILGAYGIEILYNTIMMLKARNGHEIKLKPLWAELIINKWLIKLIMIGVVCLLVIPVNPYGFEVVTGMLRTLDSVITKYIFEWQPFVFGSFIGPSLWLLIFVVFSNLRNKNIQMVDKTLAVLWMIAMLFSVRNIGFLAILAAPYLAYNLPADNQKDSNTRKILAWINNKSISPILVGFLPIVLIGSFFVLPMLGSNHYIEKTEESPMPAINYVLQNYSDKKVLNDWNYGGRIVYETKGKFPLFIDGRSGSVYSEKILTDYISFLDTSKGWHKILDSHGVEVIMIGNDKNFVSDYKKGLYHDSWRKVYNDEIASIYERVKQY